MAHTDVKRFYLKKYSSNFTSVSSCEQSRHAYMAFYFRTPGLSANFRTNVAHSGTRDARRQFRDCPGHSGTVGGPRLHYWNGRMWLEACSLCISLCIWFRTNYTKKIFKLTYKLLGIASSRRLQVMIGGFKPKEWRVKVLL